MGKTSAAAKNRYAAKAYDRIGLIVPKGEKATVAVAAKKVGESVNMYIQRAILARMGLEEWPSKSADNSEESTEQKSDGPS